MKNSAYLSMWPQFGSISLLLSLPLSLSHSLFVFYWWLVESWIQFANIDVKTWNLIRILFEWIPLVKIESAGNETNKTQSGYNAIPFFDRISFQSPNFPWISLIRMIAFYLRIICVLSKIPPNICNTHSKVFYCVYCVSDMLIFCFLSFPLTLFLNLKTWEKGKEKWLAERKT